MKDKTTSHIRRGGTYVVRAAERPVRSVKSRPAEQRATPSPSTSDRSLTNELRRYKQK